MIKMKILSLFVILSFLLISDIISAQDKIIKVDTDTIYCRIIKYTNKKVTYSQCDSIRNNYYIIYKDHINYIVLDSSKTVSYMGNITYSEGIGSTVALKFHPFSPLFGHIALSLEGSVSASSSIEFGYSYIYNYPVLLNTQSYTNTNGFSVRLGYKFIKASSAYKLKQKHPHLLQGFYFKPEVLFTKYSTQSPSDVLNNNTSQVICLSITPGIGKQIVIKKTFLFDWYIGCGPAFQSNNSYMYYYNQLVVPLSFINILINNKAYLSITAGIRIGIVFQ